MTAPRDVHPWDLWILRALDPLAGPAEVRALRSARARHRARARALRARLLAGDRTPLAPGRRLFAARPDLARGMVLPMRLGPYPCVLEPFLDAGCDVAVAVDAATARRLRPLVELLRRSLGWPGRPEWFAVDRPAAARRLSRRLRDGGAVVAFADLDPGSGGSVATRRGGVPYRLPGREIRVPAGLARAICRAECPVHPVAVGWGDDGRSVVWIDQPTQRWSRRDQPAQVAQRLFDWVFHEVCERPAEWSSWPLLVTSAACFAAPEAGGIPPGLHADYRHAFRICQARAAATVGVELEAEIAVWPGGVLADLTGERFFDADGLRDEDLTLLREGRPLLADLCARHGRTWVDRHVLRLCLLGLARLAGPPAVAGQAAAR